ncbi:MAG: ferrous iron transport protein B [Myxococcota bacterium]
MSSQSPAPRAILIAGNPNAGKTTLFNQLAGTKARTGNYPGVTVDRRSAKVRLGGDSVELVDVPGTYSLAAASPEERIAVDSLLVAPPAAAVVVVDATALARGLYLVRQVLETGVPTVVALNMMDEARAQGLRIDTRALAESLGVRVVELVASRGEGIDDLRAVMGKVAKKPWRERRLELPELAERCVEGVEAAILASGATQAGTSARVWALWALLSLAGEDERDENVVPDAWRDAVRDARAQAATFGIDLEDVIVGARYARVDAAVAAAVSAEENARPGRSDRIDRVLTHPVLGLLAFAVVMYVVFESIYGWADPFVGAIEDSVGWLQELVRAGLPEGLFRDLLADGVVAGVGNVVVFVPQIAMLFLLINFLEDSGYLARVAFVIDRVMKGVGLHGKAFVPLLSGFACAIPAVMATRTIEKRGDRLITMMALPLMSCSARLPVYVLVIGVVFAGEERVFGVFSAGALALFAMYVLSVIATLAAAAVMRRTVVKGPAPTLVLELPPYRVPLLRNLLGTTWQRVRSFLVDAGTVILALTIVLWALLTFPQDPAGEAQAERKAEAAVAYLEGDDLDAELARIDAQRAQSQLAHSAAGRLGKAIEPALEPLGMDWRIGIGVIGAFAAREVFVSTLGMVFGVGEVDEEDPGLRARLRTAERPDGSPLMTPLAGIALMVFFVLAAQCMSTLAVLKREAGSWKWPVFVFAYMTALAYVAALLVYQVGSAFGWGTA